MINIPECHITKSNEPQSDTNWHDIYNTLRPIAKHIVYRYRATAWLGQENDIAEDIIQETVRKLFEYERKVQRGESVPIHSLVPMMRVIAHNYSKDMLRHDNRVIRIDANNTEMSPLHEEINVEECGTENAYNEIIFREMARAIASFPSKQRHALLIDIAAHMSFEQQPTPLQQAFANAGIQLQAYRNMVPGTSQGHNQHTSLVAHAYKRVTHLPGMSQYIDQ